MRSLLTIQFSAKLVLVLLSMVVLFHLLVLFGFIPFQIVWGGRLKNQSEMYSFEAASIIVNLIMLLVVAIKAGFVRFKINSRIVTILLWLMFALFLLNTLGNLLSVNKFEKMVFTPLTLILSVLCFRLAYGDTKKP